MVPLVEGIAQRFSKCTLGEDAAGFTEILEKFPEVVEVAAGLQPTGALAIKGPGSLFSEFSFDVVDSSDLKKDPGGGFWMILLSFEELAPDVRETAGGDDVQVRIALDEGAIGSQTVALKAATEGVTSFFVDEDVVEAGVGAAFVPVKKWPVFEVMVGPEVSGGGFAFTGFEAVDGRFIDLDVVAATDALGDDLIKWMEPVGKVIVPVAHVVSCQFDAVGGAQTPFLSIEGLMVAKFFGEQESSEAGCENAAGKEAGLKWWSERDGVRISFANVDLALDDLAGEGAWTGVESDAGFFAEKAKEFGIGEDLRVGNGALDGGQSLE